jgi:tetrahydromethanopterin S-methyltransferase subunit A
VSIPAIENPALEVVRQELIRLAMAATKCHRCGCLPGYGAGAGQQSSVLFERFLRRNSPRRPVALFEPKRYDCLGCEVCWPAVATNAAAETRPGH